MSETVATKRRVGWVDTGRGIAILLVPLYHATNWLISAGFPISYWTEINVALSTLRMPLFFMLAGLFAPKWLHVPWSQLWRSKLFLFVWVFAVWEVIGAFVFQVGLAMQDKCCGIKDSVINLALSPLAPEFELWFLWALVIFFVVAKLTRNIDWRAQLIGAGVLSVLALSGGITQYVPWLTQNVGWIGAPKYFFFFLSGLYVKRWIDRIAAIKSPLFIGGAFVLWAVVSVSVAVLNLGLIPGVYFVNCVLGVIGGISLSRIISRLKWVNRIGQQTLPIYLAHTPIIILVAFVISQPVLRVTVIHIDFVAPIIVAGIGIYLAYQLHKFASTRVLKFLYEPPESVVRKLSLRP